MCEAWKHIRKEHLQKSKKKWCYTVHSNLLQFQIYLNNFSHSAVQTDLAKGKHNSILLSSQSDI